MSRTKDLWIEQHEAAISRFVTGEDDAAMFVTALRKLGFSTADIQQQINNTIAERDHEAAHAAGRAFYEQYSGDGQ
jgi:Holliday junction resolvasome RuvABC DNA-binding subunit